MIKKLLLSSVLLFVFALPHALAQCTPVPFPPPPLTNPDTTQGIPMAYAGHLYDEVIHIRVPADTLVYGTLLPIDSVGIDSITGLPPSFTWTTNKPSNYWEGGTYGCIRVQGNPTMADTGKYEMVLHAKFFVGHNPNNTVLYTANFSFQILDSALMGIAQANSEAFLLFPNSPNPFEEVTYIRFQSPVSDMFEFSVYNVAGAMVHQEKIEVHRGVNTIEFHKNALPSGMYIYRLANEEVQVRRQMIIR